jgi:thymidylate synthase
MRTLNVRNVHEALPEGCRLLLREAVKTDSRNGTCYQLPGPLTTTYREPQERVLFWATRDANPFFHLFESLWMLGGRNDVAYVKQFNSRIGDYSDDGKTFNGAYGHRWRQHYNYDQLSWIITSLAENPDCRRQVLSIFDGRRDLGLTSRGCSGSKDIPCNTQAYFQVNMDGELEMMVVNRSNDLIWGAYGANAVHFSYLQEYVASALRREVGPYHQVSMNTHFYEQHLSLVEELAAAAFEPRTAGEHPFSPYDFEAVKPFPLMAASANRSDWEKELERFLSLTSTIEHPESSPLSFTRTPHFKHGFFGRVVWPLARAWAVFKKEKGKETRIIRATAEAEKCAAGDWKRACLEWLQRRS